MVSFSLQIHWRIIKEILIFAGEFIRDLVALESGGSGGVVWRIRANATKLVCAVGSRNGTEETKLLVLDFDAVDSKWISRISWFYQKWVFNPFFPLFQYYVRFELKKNDFFPPPQLLPLSTQCTIFPHFRASFCSIYLLGFHLQRQGK